MNVSSKTGGSIELSPLKEHESRAIREWPPYPGYFAALDYVLRPNGWLDMFPHSSTNLRFGVFSGVFLVGFTMLVGIDRRQAEFYIALHADKIGQGIGQQATKYTLQIAFDELGLTRVYLRVRTSHDRGIRLYEHVGFRPYGTKLESINGQMVQLQSMEIRSSEFRIRYPA
jgi:RimJ/RimL family protein N-acetyltransferase